MGICSFAIVEVAQSLAFAADNVKALPSGRHWWVLIQEISFNKNASLRMALRDHQDTESGWPDSACPDSLEYAEDNAIDQGRFWCSAKTFIEVVAESLLSKDVDERLTGQPSALMAFLLVMQEESWVKGLRLLFWES